MDLLLAIGLETISLGTAIFISDALQQTVTIGDGVTAFRGIVVRLDAFGGFRCFQRLDRFCLEGAGGDVDGKAACFSRIRGTIAARFPPEEFSLDAFCGRHRPEWVRARG